MMDESSTNKLLGEILNRLEALEAWTKHVDQLWDAEQNVDEAVLAAIVTIKEELIKLDNRSRQ